MKLIVIFIGACLLSACSVFGDSGVESAPYTLLSSDEEKGIEVRNYESMVLVSTSMSSDGENSAFRKLFKYITGANEGAREIAMTAPVFMDEQLDKSDSNNQGSEIAMTAPVFMNENSDTPSMSFVMPKDFTLETTPKPTNPDVRISEITDYKVAAIRFSGTLSESNMDEHTQILRKWIVDNQYTQVGEVVTAGYNGPLTLPMFRHNEVIIEIK